MARRLTMLMVLLLFLGSAWVAYCWRQEAALQQPWSPDPEDALFAQRPLLPYNESNPLASPLLTHTPLHTLGRHIVDAQDRRFKLASVNWYGASDELFIPSGLDIQHRSEIAKTIRRLGFNSVRLPYADEMVLKNPPIAPSLLAANADLVGLKAMDIYAAVVNSLTEGGLAVVINNHITHSTWCCGADPCDGLWYNDHLPPTFCRIRQTEDQWLENWVKIMTPHTKNPLVIGADLRNEVRALWGTIHWRDWAKAAERAGNRLLRMNPNWLMFVGGTGSQNFLDGVRDRPVVLEVADRVVYSSHVYSWSGWGSREGRYAQRSYASFVKSMRENWAYLLEEDIAPVWVGEFGGPHEPNQGDAHYWKNLLRFLKTIDADFAYWAINPRKPKNDNKETYSLVEDDWETPVLDYRMRDMQELMTQ